MASRISELGVGGEDVRYALAMSSPVGIFLPPVEETVQGSEALARWRQRQLASIGRIWLLPMLGLVLGSVLGAVGALPLSAILLVPSLAALVVAPGMTVVYVLRYRRAGRVGELLPRMPQARIEAGGAARALPPALAEHDDSSP